MKTSIIKQTMVSLLFLLGLFLLSFYSADCQEETHIVFLPDKFNSILPCNARPKLVVDGSGDSESGFSFIEGPSWMNGKLYFSNIIWGVKRGEQGLHVLNPDGTVEALNSKVKTEGSSPLQNGNFAICDMGNYSIIEMTPLGKVVRTLADSCNGNPLGEPNDLITDTRGGIYFTQPKVNNLPGNAVYYINPERKVIRVTGWSEFDSPNGCVMSPDGSKFYLGDFHKTTVWMFDVNEDGTFSNKRPFGEVIRGEKVQNNDNRSSICVDGMTIDRAGNLYISTSTGIQVFDRTGVLIGVIVYPKRIVHCVFGGEDMSTLYALTKDQIYSLQTKVKGFQYPITGE